MHKTVSFSQRLANTIINHLQDKASKQTELSKVQKEFEQISLERQTLKEKLFSMLQSHAAYNKAANYAKSTTTTIVQHVATLVNFNLILVLVWLNTKNTKKHKMWDILYLIIYILVLLVYACCW